MSEQSSGRGERATRIYIIQLWDDTHGWVNVSDQGKPMAFFRKKDAAPDIERMRANIHNRCRYSANPFFAPLLVPR